MPKVTFVREGKEINVEKGANLRRAAMEAGISVYQGMAKLFNCLGNGMCGTCLVYVKQGKENCSEKGLLESLHLQYHPITVMHASGHEEEARLSCQMQVHDDIVVDTQPSINLHGEEEHAYEKNLKGSSYVEFPDHAPRGVREKKERKEKNVQKDWFHKKRTIKAKTADVKASESEDEESQDSEQEETSDNVNNGESS